MFSLEYSYKEAHTDAIWCCAWGELRIDDDAADDEATAGGEENGQDDDDKPKGKLCDCIVTGSVDDTVKVWIFENNKLEHRKTLTGHSLGVVSVALNSDCSICASSSLDSVLILWDLKNGTKIKSIMVGPTELWTIAFSPDDNYIISGSHSGKINMFNVETTKLEQTFDTRGKFTLSVAYSSDGNKIASGALDGIVNVFDVQNAKLTNTLEGHAMPIRSLCFSPDSKYLLTASDDGHMKVYDVQHATVVSPVSGHASWVLNVAFSPANTKYFVSASADNTVKVWQLLVSQMRVDCVHTFNEHSDQVWCVKYNKSGTNIVSVSEDKSINIYSCPPTSS